MLAAAALCGRSSPVARSHAHSPARRPRRSLARRPLSRPRRSLARRPLSRACRRPSPVVSLARAAARSGRLACRAAQQIDKSKLQAFALGTHLKTPFQKHKEEAEERKRVRGTRNTQTLPVGGGGRLILAHMCARGWRGTWNSGRPRKRRGSTPNLRRRSTMARTASSPLSAAKRSTSAQVRTSWSRARATYGWVQRSCRVGSDGGTSSCREPTGGADGQGDRGAGQARAVPPNRLRGGDGSSSYSITRGRGASAHTRGRLSRASRRDVRDHQRF